MIINRIIENYINRKTVADDHIFNIHGFDRELYNDIVASDPVMHEAQRQGADVLPGFPALFSDIFFYLWRFSLQEKDSNQLTQLGKLNRQVFDRIRSELDKLRSYTVGDMFMSSYSTVTMAETVRDKLLQLVEENEKVRQLIQQLQQLQSTQDGQGDSGLDQQLIDDLTDQLAKAIAGAADEVSEDLSLLGMFASREAGKFSSSHNLDTSNLEKKMAIARQFMKNRTLRDVLSIAGQLKPVVKKAIQKHTTGDLHTIHSVTTGSSIMKAIPSELMNITNPATRKDFFRRMYQNQILTYQCRDKLPLGYGPVVICLDSSGSMSGERDVWSKAVALSILEIAYSQKRDICIICFDTTIIATYFFMAKQPLSYEQVYNFCSLSPYGGTSFDTALEEAIGVIETSKQERRPFHNADIIFITDGEDSVSDYIIERIQELKKSGLNIFSIHINEYGCESSALERFSDEIVPVDISGAGSATDIQQASAIIDKLADRFILRN